MRILLVTMGMDIGGAETHILELAKELKKRGNEVFVASNGGKYVGKLEEANIEHIYAPLNNKKIRNVLKSYKILKKTIKEKNIDLVHSHTRITSFICGVLKKILKFPYVTTAHGVFKITPLLKIMTDWGENVIAVSDDIKKYLLENYNIKEDNIFLTVNGIDTENFNKNIKFDEIEKEFNLKKNAKRIVNISRLDENTSIVAETLINSAEFLNNKIENLEILIVGDGDAFEKLKNKATKINEKVNKNLIIMTGARTDINKFTSCGSIFVGVSRAALEAMACEKSVILAGNQGYLRNIRKSKIRKSYGNKFLL